jgi:asparagine synthase (glutamine-hydrolysing)
MTIIAGITGIGAPARFQQHCRSAIAVQRLFADSANIELDHSQFAVLAGSPGTLGRPSKHSNPQYSLVADIRFDNRAELIADLGLSNAEQSDLADADLLLLSWSKWEAGLLDRLAGSFAFAVHDQSRNRTFLVRDPFGERPLNFGVRGGRLSFASMPIGVWPEEALSPDLDVLAKQYRDCLLPPEQSNFHNVTRVAPGHFVEFVDGSVRTRRYWEPDSSPSTRTDDELVAEFRFVLDKAVDARLSSRSSPTSSMLSSGFDSSSVTGTAARLLDSPELLTAFTSAPAYNDILLPVSRFADETPIAAQSAKMLGIQHRVIRDKTPILSSIRGLSQYFQAPAPNPINLGWWRRIMDEVRATGQSSILVAVEGNFTVSYGGTFVLPTYIRHGRWLRWFRETRHIVRSHTYLRWRGALFSSFESRLPRVAKRSLQRLFDREPYLAELDFMNPAFTDPSPEPAVHISGDLFADRLALLSLHDNGERYKGMTALTGVDERDPTVDRRLVEFCLSLRPEHLLNRGEPRPLAREAFSDRMNAQVFDFTVRGHQSADWYCRLLKREAVEMLDEIRTTRAAELLDIPKLDIAIHNWPEFDPKAYWTLMPFSRSIWQTLNIGLFLAETERCAKQRHQPGPFSQSSGSVGRLMS